MPVDEPWFRNLKIDFSKRTAAKAFHGYLKQSPDYSTTNKIWRLYLTLDLDDYIEFNEDDDYLGSVPVDTAQNQVGGTVVWLKAASDVHRVNVESRQAQAEFLRGKIASAHLGRTGKEALLSISPMKIPPETQALCTQVTYCKSC